MAHPLLWVEDDPALRRVYRPLLTAEGYALTEATTAAEALAAAKAQSPKLVLLDLMLPPSQTKEEGLGVLDALLERDPGVKVVVVTGAGGRDTALEAVRRGAHDFLSKPVDPDVLLVVLERARARAHLEAEVHSLRDRLAASSPRGAMLGESATFLAAVDLADRVAPTDLPALITGENGTGKELLARRVHAGSRRAGQPFVAVNCGALPPTLLESTLFGHVRGAFTGASQSRRGLFQEAHGGTLFLDEVAEMEPPTQVRLLRALESGEILPVGADRPVMVDVRLVSATNRDLDAMVASGEFRDDLYWRLRGIEVTLPPLRDRGDDVLLLARHFLNSSALGGTHELSPRAMDSLRAHPWPGNLRELRHAMQRAAVMAGARALIEPADLGLRALETPDGGTLAAQLEALERRAIGAALAAEGGNRTRAAKRLGLSRQGLLNKIARYELD
ncbi:MAG: sigma-54-dependent Fis family transcriptional regulator [Alphaproteobacteria bacterium]|nr:sigma-54-dependent Fis family transcriptional regulator [Alphaproteobacteria bacterium]MCB9794710.1 sigma-54-dependent Fis family transcriptional regulator [Alphaproteobacteria bacterium]